MWLFMLAKKKDGDNDTSTFNVAGRMRAERKQNLYGNLTNFITTFIKYIILAILPKEKEKIYYNDRTKTKNNKGGCSILLYHCI